VNKIIFISLIIGIPIVLLSAGHLHAQAIEREGNTEKEIIGDRSCQLPDAPGCPIEDDQITPQTIGIPKLPHIPDVIRGGELNLFDSFGGKTGLKLTFEYIDNDIGFTFSNNEYEFCPSDQFDSCEFELSVEMLDVLHDRDTVKEKSNERGVVHFAPEDILQFRGETPIDFVNFSVSGILYYKLINQNDDVGVIFEDIFGLPHEAMNDPLVKICVRGVDTVTINLSELGDHLDHGDSVGECEYTWICLDDFNRYVPDVQVQAHLDHGDATIGKCEKIDICHFDQQQLNQSPKTTSIYPEYLEIHRAHEKDYERACF